MLRNIRVKNSQLNSKLVMPFSYCVNTLPLNYLAHIYLSGTNPEIKIGNFIGDYVKGKAFNNYPSNISKGIIVHRNIDSFTDNHKIVNQSKAFFRDEFGLYSGILVDLFYDHFLAKNWDEFHAQKLLSFTRQFYFILIKYYRIIPPRVQSFLPFMIQSNRLYSYSTLNGIETALKIMMNYTSLPNQPEVAMEILTQNYKELEHQFSHFMTEIKHMIKTEFKII